MRGAVRAFPGVMALLLLLLECACTVPAALVNAPRPPVISLTLAGSDGDVFRHVGKLVTHCEVGRATKITCPAPVGVATDHHDNNIEVRTTVYLINLDGQMQAPGTVRPAIDYSRRAEWLLTYDAEDASGNVAEQLTFTMVIDDLAPPRVVVPWAGFPTRVESCSGGGRGGDVAHRCSWLVPLTAQAFDNVDGDVTQEIRITVVPPLAVGDNTSDTAANSTNSGVVDAAALAAMPGAQTYTQVPTAKIPIDTRVLGNWTVLLRAKDHAGMFGKGGRSNQAVVRRTVLVRDTSPPDVLCRPAQPAAGAVPGTISGVAALEPAPTGLHTYEQCAATCFRQQYTHAARCVGGSCASIGLDGGLSGRCVYFALSPAGDCSLYGSAASSQYLNAVASTPTDGDTIHVMRTTLGEVGKLEQCATPNVLECGAEHPSSDKLRHAFADAGALCIDARDSFAAVTGALKVSAVAVLAQTSPRLDDTTAGTYRTTYSCKDAAGNAAPVATRTVMVRDTKPPSVHLFGTWTVQLVCGDPSNNATINELLAAGDGFTCSDQCSGNLDYVNGSAAGVSATVFSGDCAGSYACIDQVTGKASTCHGGNHPAVAPEAALVPGRWAIKYLCVDPAGHSMARCRHIITQPSAVCNPTAAPTQPTAALAQPTPVPTPAPVDCIMSDWSSWSACTAECGRGVQQRHRVLLTPQDMCNNHGRQAVDEIRDCNLHPCPVHCRFAFMDWGKCDKSCGGGAQRSEVLVFVNARHGGRRCPVAQQRPCNEGPCPNDCAVGTWGSWTRCSAKCGDAGRRQRERVVLYRNAHGGRPCPVLIEHAVCNRHACAVACEVGSWGAWGLCSQPCGAGDQARSRAVITPPVHGGEPCPPTVGMRNCNIDPCPQHCRYTWEAWSQCTRSCGGGERTRGRYIVLAAAFGGKPCPSVQQETCQAQPCPLDCALAQWGDWTSCSASCDGGTRSRERAVAHAAAEGGKPCGAVRQSETCSEVPCPIPCAVSAWASWGDCTEPCGGGVRRRERTIVQPPAAQGRPCPALAEEEECNPRPCPVDCVFQWQPWGACSATCGGGQQRRVATVHVDAAHGGQGCPQSAERLCSTVPCPQDCVLTPWGKWHECTRTCGTGTQQSERTVSVAALHGGKACGPLVRTAICEAGPCPVDCRMEPWGSWGKCTEECGVGTSTRTRGVHTYPANGGIPCGENEENRNCNVHPCPIDCEYTWEPWTRCSRTCGGGTQTRGYYVTRNAAHGGRECPGFQEQVCAADSCPKDCVLSAWRAWSVCSESCGGGTRTRSRDVVEQPQHGGQLCGALKESQQCHVFACPVDCRLSEWSDFSECSVSCGGGVQRATRLAERSAEFGGRSCGATKTERNCMQQACPKDCVLNEWSTWGACSRSCGEDGVRLRHRGQAVSPAFGGKPCGAVEDTQDCNAVPCPVDCVTTDWSDWTACSMTCGPGIQRRLRVVQTQASSGGAPCGEMEQTQPCTNGVCPVKCVTSPFSAWSACSKTCGGGEQTRVRHIVTRAQHGATCPSLAQTRACGRAPCPSDCVVTAFGNWSACTRSCGAGEQRRSRAELHRAQHGGTTCPPLAETRTCHAQSCPVDCDMGSWGIWTACSASCGGGSRVRRRAVLQEAAFGGAPCGAPADSEICSTHVCAVDCILSQWGAWEDCPVQCGVGEHRRHRAVERPAGFGGRPCGATEGQKACNTHACAVNCVASPWTAWSACSTTCGRGAQSRSRTISQMAQFGGAECEGGTVQHQSCTDGVCPIHCEVSPFTPWTVCTKTCGTGSQTRKRSVVRHASAGGSRCPTLSQMRHCGARACPVPCELSMWSPWGECSQTCGGGAQSHARQVLTPPAHGGTPCAALVESRVCNAQNCAVDCAMSAWGAWLTCSKTCGGGTSMRYRSVDVRPLHGGRACGALSEANACSEQSCPVHCVLAPWSEWSECTQPCGSGLQTRNRTVLTAPMHGGTPCPVTHGQQSCNVHACPVACEFRLEGWSPCSRTCGRGEQSNPVVVISGPQFNGTQCPRSLERVCNPEPCPIDCVESSFSEWQVCSKSCGGGKQLRTRAVHSPAEFGGKACAALIEGRRCNVQPCPIDCVEGPWTGWNSGRADTMTKTKKKKKKKKAVDGGALSDCSRSCGTGWRTRKMLWAKQPWYGGKPCGQMYETETCNTEVCPVDCEVGGWSQWSPCTKSCGGGEQTRTRQRLRASAFGGASCPHIDEMRACSTQSCPVDCVVGIWSALDACSATCGAGTSRRTRVVVTQPSDGGTNCPTLSEERPCFLGACSSHCVMSQFSPWTPCSRTCGSGTQTQHRKVLQKPAGSVCPFASQARACNEQPCPVDCVMSVFSAWSPCTVSCGGGESKRRRGIITAYAFGGKTCGPEAETRQCNAQVCPVDCVLSAWGDWSACSTSCGHGTSTRRRSVLQDVAYGGEACDALAEDQTCSTTPCPVDCTMGAWGAWSVCSVSCGKQGVHLRRRSIQHYSVFGGKGCGASTQIESCNTQSCPINCVMSHWYKWSKCSASCGLGTHRRKRRIVVPAEFGGLSCPELTEMASCSDGECPIHCEVSEYSKWSACSKSCGAGSQSRNRAVIHHASNTGYRCPMLTQGRLCNRQPCPIDCAVSEFGAWSACTHSCGSGTSERQRGIVMRAGAGGKPCPHLVEGRQCNMHVCPADCMVSAWSGWHSCSTTCGGGIMHRYRSVSGEAVFGGVGCPVTKESATCATHGCPVDCVLAAWGAWGECSQPCGGGIATRDRTILTSPLNGGLPCQDLHEDKACGTRSCEAVCHDADQEASWTECTSSCGGGTQRRLRNMVHAAANCPPAQDRLCNEQPCPIDCSLGAWSSWSICSRTCGFGFRFRYAQPVQVPLHGGRQCAAMHESELCATQPCPIDCVETQWDDWEECSRACGTGVQERRRFIARDPAYGGRACASLSEKRLCNTEGCPVDCSVSDFGPWSVCTQSCGSGMQIRVRVVQKSPAHGGFACPRLRDSRICDTVACPVDCAMSSWGQWNICSTSCGGGTKTRTRTETNPAVFGGKPCATLIEMAACSTHACPVDCAVTAWTEWSVCSRTCDVGKQFRSRAIASHAQAGGKSCPPLAQDQACTEGKCPINCKVSEYSAWSVCTATCGRGTQSRARTVDHHAAHGGYSCPGLMQTRECNSALCPSDCVVGSFSTWSVCTTSCGTGFQHRHRKVLARPAGGGKSCPVLIELRRCGAYPCALDCVVSSWLPWSDCSARCGGGSRTRRRSIAQAPAFGGAECPTLQDSQHCNTLPCAVDCVVSPWGAWSACTATCGTHGQQTRHRGVDRQMGHGGALCPDTTHTRSCNARPCPVDCVPSAWQPWTACQHFDTERRCGAGTRMRWRSTIVPASHGGRACGPDREHGQCGTAPCPVHCEVGAWSAWSACDKTCGSGTFMRSREVTQHARHGGYTCPELQQKRACNEMPCPADCVVGAFGNWTKCTRSCGTGMQHRERSVVVPVIAGGKACPVLAERRQCNAQPCPIDCVPSSWGQWSPCSESCGGGARQRFRNTAVRASFGGRPCPVSTQASNCSTTPCPVDAIVSQWSSWSACTVSCGTGSQHRTRNTTRAAAHGGRTEPALFDDRLCHEHSCPVDCLLTEWGAWTECGRTCGAGQQLRHRSRATESLYGGSACGALSESRLCNTHSCPANCILSAWQEWSVCSRSCDGGEHKRMRTVLVEPTHDGAPCGALSQTQACNKGPCPVHCEVSAFTDWTPCTKSCGVGGQQRRMRSVTQREEHGGAVCPLLVEERVCGEIKCPRDCKVRQWASWSACSATCGEGLQGRHREVAVRADAGGKGCPILSETRACAEQPCRVDCVMSTWRPWSVCSASCGVGHRTRRRSIMVAPAFYGAACPALQQTEACTSADQPSCPVDCITSVFTAWTLCTRSCGAGTQTRHRTVQIAAFMGGQACGALLQTRSCNTQSCPVDCVMTPWASWTRCMHEDQTRQCGPGTRTRKRAVKLATAHGGALCGATMETEWCSERPCPVDCLMSPWGAWHECSTSCGRGVRVRHRGVNQSPMFGGVPCGALEEAGECGGAPCKVDCEVSTWGSWSPCDTSCGGGNSTRYRSVDRQMQHGGMPCPALSEAQSCNAHQCPVDCTVSPWTDWSPCSVTCATGTQSRSRSVLVDAASGGRGCPALEQHQQCTNGPCWQALESAATLQGFSAMTFSPEAEQAFIAALAAGLGVPAAAISISDLGKERRRRLREDVGVPSPHARRLAADADENLDHVQFNVDLALPSTNVASVVKEILADAEFHSSFVAKLQQELQAHGYAVPSGLDAQQEAPHDVDVGAVQCDVSLWGQWSQCTRTCGGGMRSRARTVKHDPLNNGYTCPTLKEQQACSERGCPVDCALEDWGSWSECARTCGGARQHRLRLVRQHPAHGGAICGATIHERSCNDAPCPIDCLVSNWGVWKECSATCGSSGAELSYRSQLNGPSFGGTSCPELRRSRPCNVRPCPQDCVVGIWGAWTSCSRQCGPGTHTRTRPQKVPAAHGGLGCPALEQEGDCEVRPCPIDCVFTARGWDKCTATCGGGTQSFSYEIHTQAQHGGRECPETALRMCAEQPCPLDCKVTSWGAWSVCSASCGGGSQTRTRVPVAPPMHGGLSCPPLQEDRSCETQYCPVDCTTFPFSRWTPCTVTCGGGVRSRHRAIQHAAANGGHPCPALSDTEQCGEAHCPQDCVLGDWGGWGMGGPGSEAEKHERQQNAELNGCSAACGGGVIYRSRSVSTWNKHGGKGCGALDEYRNCNTHACPTHCQYQWMAWTPCTATCGGGMQRQPIEVLREPANGGQECPVERERVCGTAPCPMDCKLSGWGAFEPCDASCGGGTKRRVRSIVRDPMFGGSSCPQLDWYEACATQPCPIDCVVAPFSPWGECSVTCGWGGQYRERAVLHAAAHGGVACPAPEEVRNCNSFPCPADCVLSEWSEWSQCSEPCGKGVRTRSRAVVTDTAFGGKPCGAFQIFDACNTHPCPVACEHEWVPWSPCSKTCGSGFQKRDVVVLQEPMHGGRECPDAQERLCNTFACPKAPPTPAPSVPPPPPPPTPRPTHPEYKPVISIIGRDKMVVEATPVGFYRDPGATCIDQLDGDISPRVEVGGVVLPRLDVPGVYRVEYDCMDQAGVTANRMVRTVEVRDSICPVCEVHGDANMTVEAGFPFVDPGATCVDNLDGELQVTTVSRVDTGNAGRYLVTYSARDKAGNWNDAKGCVGGRSAVRVVTVVDTLKPRINLRYKGTVIAKGAASDVGVGGQRNPVGVGAAAANVVLMAEIDEQPPHNLSATAVMYGAVGALCAAAFSLTRAQRSRAATSATSAV